MYILANSLKRLANILKTRAEERGFKTKLRESAGISASQLDGYISQAVCPSLDVFDRLAEALDREPWQLISPPDMPGRLIPIDILNALDRCTPQDFDALRLYLFATGKLNLAPEILESLQSRKAKKP